jgi:hypothetical protein
VDRLLPNKNYSICEHNRISGSGFPISLDLKRIKRGKNITSQ